MISLFQKPLTLVNLSFHRGTWSHLHAWSWVWQLWQPSGAGQGLLRRLPEALSAVPGCEALHPGLGFQRTDLPPGPHGWTWHEGRWSPLWRLPSVLSPDDYSSPKINVLYQRKAESVYFPLSEISRNRDYIAFSVIIRYLTWSHFKKPIAVWVIEPQLKWSLSPYDFQLNCLVFMSQVDLSALQFQLNIHETLCSDSECEGKVNSSGADTFIKSCRGPGSVWGADGDPASIHWSVGVCFAGKVPQDTITDNRFIRASLPQPEILCVTLCSFWWLMDWNLLWFKYFDSADWFPSLLLCVSGT